MFYLAIAKYHDMQFHLHDICVSSKVKQPCGRDMKLYYERWRIAIPTYVAMLTYLIKLVLQQTDRGHGLAAMIPPQLEPSLALRSG